MQEANKMLQDYKNGVVHEVRSNMQNTSIDKKLIDVLGAAVKLAQQGRDNKLKWAADLSVVDDEVIEGSRPSSANTVGASTLPVESTHTKTLWKSVSTKKVQTPAGDVPEQLSQALGGLVSGDTITFRMKKAPYPTTATFEKLSPTGMMEVCIPSKTSQNKQVLQRILF